MHKNKHTKNNKQTKNNKRTKKYSKKQQKKEKLRIGKTMKNNICKKGFTDEAYKYYKYTEFFKNSNKKSLDMDKDKNKDMDKDKNNKKSVN